MNDNGFTQVNWRAGNSVDNFMGKGGSGGYATQHRCPHGQKIVGTTGRSGNRVDKLGFI